MRHNHYLGCGQGHRPAEHLIFRPAGGCLSTPMSDLQACADICLQAQSYGSHQCPPYTCGSSSTSAHPDVRVQERQCRI